jgi:hypothetical protein
LEKIIVIQKHAGKVRKKNPKSFGFLRFSQTQGPGGKICNWYIIEGFFPEHLTPLIVDPGSAFI